MKTPQTSLLPPTAAPTPPRRRRRAFSLVEVTLALGIVTFALVGVVGVLPTALASGRQSSDQNRASAIANTLFASFRSQPFTKVGYLDEHFYPDGVTPADSVATPRLNLNSTVQASADTVTFYATFLNVSTETADGDSFGSQRRLSFTKLKPNMGTSYRIVLNFNNAPDGMVLQPPRDNQSLNLPTQANQVAMTISSASNQAASQLGDQYRFVSTIANRVN